MLAESELANVLTKYKWYYGQKLFRLLLFQNQKLIFSIYSLGNLIFKVSLKDGLEHIQKRVFLSTFGPKGFANGYIIAKFWSMI